MQAKLSSMRDVHPVINLNTATALSPNDSPVDEPEKGVLRVGAAPKDGDGANETEADRKDEDSEHSKPQNDSNKSARDTITVRSSNAHEMGDFKPADASEPVGPVHAACCNVCDNDAPITGIRWKCMVCENYDLCHRCHSASIHDKHQMLKIEHPRDALSVESAAPPYEDDTNSVLLGFRVYSKSQDPINISGQLANGDIIRWEKTS